MGASHPLPLPQRIPTPCDSLAKKMIAWGFSFKSNTQEEYIGYTMPEGWKFEDKSWRADLPDWVFVDADNMEQISVSGSWKGAYDNELFIKVIKEPTPYVPRNKPAIPSETDTHAILGEVVGAVAKDHGFTRQ